MAGESDPVGRKVNRDWSFPTFFHPPSYNSVPQRFFWSNLTVLRHFLNDLHFPLNGCLKHADTWLLTFALFLVGGGVGKVSSFQGHRQLWKGYWGPRLHRTRQRWPSLRGTWRGCSTGDMICRRWRTAEACTRHRRQKPEGPRRRGPRGQLTPRERVTKAHYYSPWVCPRQDPSAHSPWAAQSHLWCSVSRPPLNLC